MSVTLSLSTHLFDHYVMLFCHGEQGCVRATFACGTVTDTKHHDFKRVCHCLLPTVVDHLILSTSFLTTLNKMPVEARGEESSRGVFSVSEHPTLNTHTTCKEAG